MALPTPPYYAVIFTTTRTDGDNGYEDMAERMGELASQQPGYLGIESVRDDNLGITVSYWESEKAIAAWKANAEHGAAREKGRELWYNSYDLKVCRVERAYEFSKK
jgi:heme-degrading monooxygenase HmoA